MNAREKMFGRGMNKKSRKRGEARERKRVKKELTMREEEGGEFNIGRQFSLSRSS